MESDEYCRQSGWPRNEHDLCGEALLSAPVTLLSIAGWRTTSASKPLPILNCPASGRPTGAAWDTPIEEAVDAP